MSKTYLNIYKDDDTAEIHGYPAMTHTLTDCIEEAWMVEKEGAEYVSTTVFNDDTRGHKDADYRTQLDIFACGKSLEGYGADGECGCGFHAHTEDGWQLR